MAKDSDIQKINYKEERLLRDLLQIDSYVKVGILADPDPESGNVDSYDLKTYRDAKGTIKKSQFSDILDVAIIHEFGFPEKNIPERSFLRSTANDEKQNISIVLSSLAKVELSKKDPDPFQLLGKLGGYLQSKVRKKFTVNNWRALKDPTRGGRNKQGLATPLVDTGQLRRSITYEVVEGNE